MKSGRDFNKFHFNKDKIESQRELKNTIAQLKELKAMELSGMKMDRRMKVIHEKIQNKAQE